MSPTPSSVAIDPYASSITFTLSHALPCERLGVRPIVMKGGKAGVLAQMVSSYGKQGEVE